MPNSEETTQKIQKCIYNCVLKFYLATINSLGDNILSKKSKSLYPRAYTWLEGELTDEGQNYTCTCYNLYTRAKDSSLLLGE